ncbi:hypothetical protein ACJX0J_012385, partial [Zea mays]
MKVVYSPKCVWSNFSLAAIGENYSFPLVILLNNFSEQLLQFFFLKKSVILQAVFMYLPILSTKGIGYQYICWFILISMQFDSNLAWLFLSTLYNNVAWAKLATEHSGFIIVHDHDPHVELLPEHFAIYMFHNFHEFSIFYQIFFWLHSSASLGSAEQISR